MKMPVFKRRELFLFVLLAMVAATWAFVMVDNFQLRRSLIEASLEEVRSYEAEVRGAPNAAMATRVTASHEMVLFGKTTGKVEVYIKVRNSAGVTQYSGVEIGYERQGDSWVFTDSGVCRDAECVSRAKEVFGDET